MGVKSLYRYFVFAASRGNLQVTARARLITMEANTQNIQHIAPVSRHKIQTAIAVVVPAHANLLYAIAALFGEVQNLDVEHIAIDLLAAKQIARHFTTKELEAALRIAQAPQPDNQVHGDDEGPRAEPAI